MSLKADGNPYLYNLIAGLLKHRYGYHIYGITATEETHRYVCHTHVGRLIVNLWENIELLEIADRIRERLVKGRFRQLDRFIPGIDGQRYYAQSINGATIGCTVTDYLEQVNCRQRMRDIGKTVARMHVAMKSVIDSERSSTNFLRWGDKFQLQIDQFIQARKIVEKRYMKTKADRLFLLNFYSIMQRARKALKILGETNYDSVAADLEQRRDWCHGSLHYRNIAHAGHIFITGLSEGHTDLPHFDIAFFLQSLAEEEELKATEVTTFFEGYNEISPLKAHDVKIVYSYILFPHHVWRSIYSLYLAKEVAQQEDEEERDIKLASFLTCLNTQKRVEGLFPVMAELIHRLNDEEERKEGNNDP